MQERPSPKTESLTIVDTTITIILAALNQPGTTGPTSTSTSTNDNLNKEKKSEAISKRQKIIVFMMGIYRSCGYYHTRTDPAPRYRTRQDNA